MPPEVHDLIIQTVPEPYAQRLITAINDLEQQSTRYMPREDVRLASEVAEVIPPPTPTPAPEETPAATPPAGAGEDPAADEE